MRMLMFTIIYDTWQYGIQMWSHRTRSPILFSIRTYAHTPAHGIHRHMPQNTPTSATTKKVNMWMHIKQNCGYGSLASPGYGFGLGNRDNGGCDRLGPSQEKNAKIIKRGMYIPKYMDN